MPLGRAMPKKQITVQQVTDMFTYDGIVGEIRLRVPTAARAAGVIATGIAKQKTAKPWMYVNIGMQTYAASKVAWMIAHRQVPDHPVRFANGDTTDIRLCNLTVDAPPPEVLTVEEVRRRFDYDAKTGLLLLKLPTRKNPAGIVIGHRPGKYGSVGFGKKKYLAHVIVWMHQIGKVPDGMVIDHINGKVDDNRIENLRLATHSQNRANWQKPRANASGVRGVIYCPKRNKWRAELKFNGKRYYMGRFDTIEEAAKARRAKELEVHGEFAGNGSAHAA